MTTDSIKKWFETAVPEPTDKNRAVQIGCHFEEVHEMLEAIQPGSPLGKGVRDAANDLKIGPSSSSEEAYLRNVLDDVDRVELLDALCDQIVTAIGVAHMFGMDIQGGLAEVNRSNWSKFVEGKPVFDANGKIAKPTSYTEPVLKDFV